MSLSTLVIRFYDLVASSASFAPLIGFRPSDASQSLGTILKSWILKSLASN